MSPVRGLSLALLCAALAGQEAAPKPSTTPAERRRPDTFEASVQGAMPLHGLKDDLGGRSGAGLGLQWTCDRGDRHASRTRLEWTTFPEGGPAGGARTYAKNYLLSFDHLFKLRPGRTRTYLVAGLGGCRWDLERTTGGVRDTLWTTKLAVTAGAGLRFAERASLEVRYVAGGVRRTFDADTLQLSLGWSF